MVKAEYLPSSIWSQARWLVIAPHPDDETLGAGALIAQAAQDKCLGGIVYLTDGKGSHPPATPGLGPARRREAGLAIRRLAGRDIPVDRLGWHDAQPFDRMSRRFERDARRLAAWLRHRRIDAVAVSDVQEHHCDHVAAYHLARAAIRASCRSVALFGYHVWGDPPGHEVRSFRTRSMLPGDRRRALSAHRSQLSPLFGEGFRLPPEMRRMPAADRLTLRTGAMR